MLLARLSSMQVMQLEACQPASECSAFTSKSSISVSATSKLECLSQLEATKVEANHIMAALHVSLGWLVATVTSEACDCDFNLKSTNLSIEKYICHQFTQNKK
jgi:hypothetical protein